MKVFYLFIKSVISNYWLLLGFAICLTILGYMHPSNSGDSEQIMQALAESYTAGYVFYLFSVLYPKAVRITPIIDISKENLRSARDLISGFFVDRGGYEELNKIEVIHLIPSVAKDLGNNRYEIDEITKKELYSIIRLASEYIQSVIFESEYLDSKDVNVLKEIVKTARKIEARVDRTNELTEEKVIEEMRCVDKKTAENLETNKNVHYKDDVTSLIKDLISLYANLDKIYKKYEGW